MNSITKRWVKGSLLITIAVLLVAEAVFLYFSIANYYDGARRAAMVRFNALSAQLSASAQTDDGRNLALRRMVEQFAEKDKFEMMLMDYTGHIATSTTGFVPQNENVPQDFTYAMQSDSGMGQDIYRTRQGEKVLALTSFLPETAGEIVAVRLVTSLTLLDKSIVSLVAISLAFVLLIVLFSVWSGMFFLRSIVRPIAIIETTATKIASGDLNIRIENKYNDEIGSLCNTINTMASELGKSEKMKNDFISSVSHELRTPLTSIKGWAETLGHMQPSDAGYKRGIEVIASETDRLYNMVEELLDFSRMQNGIKLNCELLDLVAEVSDTVIMMQQRARLEGVSFDFEEQELPMPVFGDKNRLRQVFVNVIDNAIKYSPENTAIKIDVLQDGVNAFVNIEDCGAGIDVEDLENVKQKFFKGKGAVRGSGIGLAVVDEIVTAHGGLLTLQSEEGRGTTVTVRLPIYTKQAAQ
ncbi:MAG: HAMP domain-containing sensor histidine kinase [Oscillospiraceae bacterium]